MRLHRAGVLAATLVCASLAHAVPASPGAVDLRNADGTSVPGRLLGDEHCAWAQDAQGNSLAWDAGEGAWRYASRDATGGLFPAGPRPGLGSPPPESYGLRPSGEALRGALDRRRRLESKDPRIKLDGTVPMLVLLVNFADTTSHFQPADFEQLYNGDAGSVQKFFLEASYGKTKIVSTVVGWLQLPRPLSYYALNPSSNNYGSPEAMLSDAIVILAGQGFDFTPFDGDQDGFIDLVDVIHAGTSAEFSGKPTDIWSHAMYLSDPAGFTTPEGIVFREYHTEGEYGPNAQITLAGVIVHETGHVFGLPDLYDTTYASMGLGLWSLMAAGSWGGPGGNGTVPTHPDAWSKQMLGYLQPRKITASERDVVIKPAEFEAAGVRIETGNDKEYFVLENRRQAGFDAYLPGAGLLVYHVDENQPGNADRDHYLVGLEQADGKRDLELKRNSGDEGDPFPFGNRDAFTPFTTPDSKSYGPIASKVFLRNIRSRGEDIVLDVDLRDPSALGDACEDPAFCPSAACADGVCCDRECPGPCNTCVAARGATEDGLCTPIEGAACDDGDPCTDGDTCAAGVCAGKAKPCVAAACRSGGTCDSATGTCAFVVSPDGEACSDGDRCTTGDSCAGGACVGTAKTCPPPDVCRAKATCIPGTGECSYAWLAEGTACEGGECRSGECRKKGCGCAAGSGAEGALAAMLAILVASRRRRQTD